MDNPIFPVEQPVQPDPPVIVVPQPTPTKHWYTSTTIIGNGIIILVIAGEIALQQTIVPISPVYQALIIAVLNILNRTRTSQGVTL